MRIWQFTLFTCRKCRSMGDKYYTRAHASATPYSARPNSTHTHTHDGDELKHARTNDWAKVKVSAIRTFYIPSRYLFRSLLFPISIPSRFPVSRPPRAVCVWNYSNVYWSHCSNDAYSIKAGLLHVSISNAVSIRSLLFTSFCKLYPQTL